MGTIIDSETGEVLSMTMPYADLLPPLSTVEKEALRASIELEGVREPVVLDELGQVLDGHHRLAIAPDAPVRVISGLTETEKVAYVYRTNFTRRNLSSDQKKDVQRRMKAIAKSLRKEGKSQAEIAALLGVPRSTVQRWLDGNISIAQMGNANTPDARVKIPPKEKAIILERSEAGETQEQIAADYGVVQPRIAQIVKQERALQEKRAQREAAAAQLTGDMDIRHGDFRILGADIPDNSIDLIFTDPPYDRARVPLYGDLAALAARVLRPGGWCLAYSGQTWLLDVLAQMQTHLTYGWMFAIQHSGGDLRYRALKLQNGWKPVLGFYKPPLEVWWEWFSDIASGGKEKQEHDWQQAIFEARHFIEALSPPGGIVLDPMAGSGTTCLAAHQAGRQWLAFEMNEETAIAARLRVQSGQ